MAMLNILSFYEDFSNLEIVLLHILNATLQYTSSSRIPYHRSSKVRLARERHVLVLVLLPPYDIRFD
jgi:hypothetical protein